MCLLREITVLTSSENLTAFWEDCRLGVHCPLPPNAEGAVRTSVSIPRT